MCFIEFDYPSFGPLLAFLDVELGMMLLIVLDFLGLSTI